MVIPIFGSPYKQKNRSAFQGEMTCPHCSKASDPTTTGLNFVNDGKPKITLKENLGPFIRVYKCRRCGGEWRYDVARQFNNPYQSFKKGLKLDGLNFKGRVPLVGGKKN